MSHHSYTNLEKETIPGLTTEAKDNLLVEYEYYKSGRDKIPAELQCGWDGFNTEDIQPQGEEHNLPRRWKRREGSIGV